MIQWIADNSLALYGALVGTIALLLNIGRFLITRKQQKRELFVSSHTTQRAQENLDRLLSSDDYALTMGEIDTPIYEVEVISTPNLGADGFMATIICVIDPNSNITGIETSGSIHNPVGRFSWGKLEIDRNPISSKRISIATTSLTVTSSGLSTFPTIQRRGSTGLRKTGALKK